MQATKLTIYYIAVNTDTSITIGEVPIIEETDADYVAKQTHCKYFPKSFDGVLREHFSFTTNKNNFEQLKFDFLVSVTKKLTGEAETAVLRLEFFKNHAKKQGYIIEDNLFCEPDKEIGIYKTLGGVLING